MTMRRTRATHPQSIVGRSSPVLHWVAVAALTLAACDGGEPAAATTAGDTPAAAGAAKTTDAKPEAEAEAAPVLPEATEILAKSIEAIGGQTALDAIDSFYYEGKVELVGQNISGDVKVWWKEGDFFTEQNMLGVGNVSAGKLGDEIWSSDPIAGLRKLEGQEAEQHMWASSLQLAADWKRYFDEAKTVAERTEDGAKVYDVELTAKTGGKVKMTFDAESGLQVGQTFDQVTPLGAMPITVKMEDYRDVEGVKIAFKQVTDAKIATATQVITKIEINPEISEARFQMPKSGADTVKRPQP
jgi:hypothetical protein